MTEISTECPAPSWVTLPKGYNRLLADYALAKLTEKLDTMESLSKLTVLTGRMLLAGLQVPKIRVTPCLCGQSPDSTPLDDLNRKLWQRHMRVGNWIKQIMDKPITPGSKYIRTLQTAMRLSIHTTFIHEGIRTATVPCYVQHDSILSNYLRVLTMRLKKDLTHVPVPKDIVPQLLLIHPYLRKPVHAVLSWVPWDSLG